MKATARACIIKDTHILLLHRFKQEKEYYVIPGGGIEKDETAAEAVIREMQEELSIHIVINKKITTMMNGEDPVTYFLVTIFTGNIAVAGPEKIAMEKDPTNKYIPEWVALDTIQTIPLVPETAKEIIYQAVTI